MKKIILLSLIVFLTSFKNYQTEFTYINFDYELKYLYYNKESSVFISKVNSKDFLRYDERAESFELLRNDRLFDIRRPKHEIEYDFSRLVPNRGFFTKIFETKETKIINNLVCTKYIEKSSSEPEPNEVFICKNHKINNTNFLVSMGLKTDVEVKGLVVEINVIKKKTNEIRTILSLKEIKENQKSLKINDEYLNEIAEQFGKVRKEIEDSQNARRYGNGSIYATVEDINDDTKSKSLPLKAEKKYINIFEKNYKYPKFNDGNWNEYAAKNFKFKTKEGTGIKYDFIAYCLISKKGVIKEISHVKPEEYKEEYTEFLNSVKDKWLPAEEYGEKIESASNIMVRIVK